MAYISETDLNERFGAAEITQLKDGDANRATNAIADADALIDSYLVSRYEIPLIPIPDVIKQKSADIARYRLYDDDAPDMVRANYDDAIAWLKLVAKGTVSLPIVDADDIGTAGIVVKARAQTFTDELFGKMPNGTDDLGL